ncbi:MAG: rod shape-determining protein MreD [Holosporales bacterium]|jgi:cell shape-determining protein MreD|nr:rod shape-determining protein MreD [Holosporales bacterium]
MDMLSALKNAAQSLIWLVVVSVSVTLENIINRQIYPFSVHLCVVVVYLGIIFFSNRHQIWGTFGGGFLADQLYCVPFGMHSALFLCVYIFASTQRTLVHSWRSSFVLFLFSFTLYYFSKKCLLCICGVATSHTEVIDALISVSMYILAEHIVHNLVYPLLK